MKSFRENMPSFLDEVIRSVKVNLESGYYCSVSDTLHKPVSLRKALVDCRKVPVIAEIKSQSPSAGSLREVANIEQIARAMVQGGAVGISVLTEPTFFKGSLNYLQRVRKVTEVPLLMKDFIVDRRQVDAGVSAGADVILIISALHDADHAEEDLEEMIDYVHKRGLEVLLEVHSRKEFRRALEVDADIIGINNRNLNTLKTDISVTEDILRGHQVSGKVIISESGFHNAEQLKHLSALNISGFLIGSSLMQSKDIESKLKGLIGQ